MMITTRRRIPHLLGATGVVLAVLLLNPGTGWLIRAQLGTPSVTSADILRMDTGSSVESPATRDLTAQPQADFEVALVATLRPLPLARECPSRTVVRRLWALVPQFPGEPALYAHILRYYTTGDVHLHRKEDYLFLGRAPRPGDRLNGGDPEILAAFDRAAAAGERLDPENAFFPTLRALGFLDRHRDGDALQALWRASRASRWNDYISQELVACRHVQERVGGRLPGIEEMVVDWSVSLSHFAECRSMARVMTYKAVQSEVAGHVEDGIAMRHTLMRLGSLMRRDSTTIIGSLTGAQVAEQATERAGGAPAEKIGHSTPIQEHRNACRQRYYTFLLRNGRPGEVEWVRATMGAGDQERAISRAPASIWPREISTLILHWLVGLALLSNGLWLLALGGLANVRWRRFGALVLLAPGSLLLVTLGVWTWRSAQAQFLCSTAHFLEKAGGGGGLSLEEITLIVAVSIAAPALLLAAASLLGLLRRQAWRSCMAGALRKAAPVMAAILLLSYAGVILATARLESSVKADLRLIETHEGRYMAYVKGQDWPDLRSDKLFLP